MITLLSNGKVEQRGSVPTSLILSNEINKLQNNLAKVNAANDKIVEAANKEMGNGSPNPYPSITSQSNIPTTDAIGELVIGSVGAFVADDLIGIGAIDDVLIPVVIIGGIAYIGAMIYEAVTADDGGETGINTPSIPYPGNGPTKAPDGSAWRVNPDGSVVPK